jgi:hypothetical protein
MNASTPTRRRLIGAAGSGLALWPLAGWPLDAPGSSGSSGTSGAPVILTITGAIRQRNDRDAASFDLPLLEALPRSSFSTRTPWYPQPRKFTGVLMRDLLAVVGATGTTLVAMALNDYRVSIPADDLARSGALLAYWLDDKPMAVRDKGPLVIVYPFDERPELRTAVHYSRAIWQLRSLHVQ